MTVISRILHGKPSVYPLALTFLFSLAAGVSLGITPRVTLLASLSISALLLALMGNRLLDLLLWSCFFVFLFSQFPISSFESMRFVLLLGLAVMSAYVARGRRFPANPVVAGVGLLAVYSLVTSPLSYHPTVCLLKSVSLFLLWGFLLFVPSAMQRLHPQVGAKEHILRVYLYLAVVVVVSCAVYYFISPSSSNEYFSGTSFLVGRYRGWFVNPNSLATLYGVFFMPILWFEARRHRARLARIALLLVLLLTGVELFATQSRAGILAGIVSMLVLGLGGRNRLTCILIVVAIAFLIGATCLASPGDNVLRRFVYRNEVRLGGSGRLSYWVAAWKRFLVRPLLGSGLGVSDTGASGEGLAFSSRGYTIQKDNSYLTALEEIGMVGCAILAATLLIPILKATWRELASAVPKQDRPSLVSAAIVVAGLSNAVFESWLLSAGNMFCLSFWTFALLLMGNDRAPEG